MLHIIRFAVRVGGGGVMGVCGPLRLELKHAWYHHAPLFSIAQFSPSRLSLSRLKVLKNELLWTAMASNDPDGVPVPCPMCRRHFWSGPFTLNCWYTHVTLFSCSSCKSIRSSTLSRVVCSVCSSDRTRIPSQGHQILLHNLSIFSRG